MAEDKIRIMHVAQAAGGVSRYLQYLLKYLSQDKFENILVCSQDYKPEEFRDYGCKLEQIEMQREIGFQDFKATIMIHGLIKRYRPHIVYAHSSKAGVIARVANINLDSACIYNPHGWSFNMRVSYKKQITYTLIERIMSHFCCKIVCISDAEKQSALNNRICREDKLEVIFNGIDIEAYDTYDHGDVTRLGLGIPKDGFVVGMVGRLCTQKAPDVFIHMAKMIKAQVPNSHFIMVGEGEMLDNVKKYAHENSLSECLHITGWVKNPLSYVRLFDVAVLLSRWEGFGLAIPEYMAANKPVVATAVDAIPNLISDGVNGLLVPEDDAYAACEAVVRLKNDLKLRTQLTNQGAKDVRRNYDAKRVSEQHAQIFASLNYLGDKMVISERIKKVVF